MRQQHAKLISIITLVLILGIFLVLWPSAGAAATTKLPRIGYLSGGGTASAPGPTVNAFRQGVHDVGYVEGKNILVEYRYVEGKNILVEYRYVEGKLDRYHRLVSELIQLDVDVLVLTAAIREGKQATRTIPIVMVTPSDPVANGIVDSLARPGGNITGLTRFTRELGGKRLQLLKEVVPTLARVAALWDANVPNPAAAFTVYETAASALKLQLQSLEVRGPNPDFESAFQGADKGRANALVTILNPLLNLYQKRIADLAIKTHLPSMHEGSSYVEAGGLMSYSANDAETFKRAAYYVDKILKGAKPADLPIEQPTRFELVINLKTAKQIGLTIPPNVLARADRVIR